MSGSHRETNNIEINLQTSQVTTNCTCIGESVEGLSGIRANRKANYQQGRNFVRADRE